MKILAKQKLREIVDLFKKQIKDELAGIIADNDSDEVHNITAQLEISTLQVTPSSESELKDIESMIENDIMAYNEVIAMAYAYVKMDNKYIYLDLDIELEEDDNIDDGRDGYYGDDDDDDIDYDTDDDDY